MEIRTASRRMACPPGCASRREGVQADRSTCETLRHEKHLFLTKAEPYNCEDPFPRLARRTEALISNEHTA